MEQNIVEKANSKKGRDIDDWLEKSTDTQNLQEEYNMLLMQLASEINSIMQAVNRPPELTMAPELLMLQDLTSMPTRYGRKIFLGGLPMGITSDELMANLNRFGHVDIDWPYKGFNEKVPPGGYAFAIFEHHTSVNRLMELCTQHGDKYIIGIRTLDGEKKIIEVKPWEMKHSEVVIMPNYNHFDRLKVFVGGLPRTITATELVEVFQDAVGGVAYVAIEIDDATEYPKGAARIVFCSNESYVRAIAMHEITIASCGTEKVAEIKPFVHTKMKCEVCQLYGATGFCPEIRCLKFCDNCWKAKHKAPGMTSHKPMQKGNYYFSAKKPRRVEKKIDMRQDLSQSHPHWSRSSSRESWKSLVSAIEKLEIEDQQNNTIDGKFGHSSTDISPFSSDSKFEFQKNF